MCPGPGGRGTSLEGLFDKLSGNGSPEVDAAVDSLEAGLPDGWRFAGLKDQLVGRRPVKHQTFGAWAKGPEGPVAALALDPVAAVEELGGSSPAARPSPPPGRHRPWTGAGSSAGSRGPR